MLGVFLKYQIVKRMTMQGRCLLWMIRICFIAMMVIVLMIEGAICGQGSVYLLGMVVVWNQAMPQKYRETKD
jgi:hypothetical protein